MNEGHKEPRKELRRRAFQAIFSLEYQRDCQEAIAFAYQYDRPSAVSSLVLPKFLLDLVEGVDQTKEELDRAIAPYLKKDWSMERISLVEKAILRLGVFEITRYDDTPPLVAVNEAVELAKLFSDSRSARFINGVLSHFIRK